MRLAQGWARIRRRHCWRKAYTSLVFLVRPASFFPSPRTPTRNRNLRSRKDCTEKAQKRPSVATRQRKRSGFTKTQNTGSRKHAVSSPPASPSACCKQRAGFRKYFLNSGVRVANLSPLARLLFFSKIAAGWRGGPSHWAVRVCRCDTNRCDAKLMWHNVISRSILPDEVPDLTALFRCYP